MDLIRRLRFALLILLASGGIVRGEDARQQAAPNSANADFDGIWVTNQGFLSLTQSGDELSGKLSDKYAVTGSVRERELSLEYKAGRSSVAVTLEMDETGRWLSGSSKSGRSTAQWFGCRQENGIAGDRVEADFSGHWLFSWGMMQGKQSGSDFAGKYGADGYGTLEGSISGNRLEFIWKRARGKGNAWVEQSPDGKRFVGQTVGTEKPKPVVGERADGYESQVKPLAGKTVRGISDHGMLYYLRMPDGWTPRNETDVIVLFHGSNFTTAGMVGVVARRWPEIAKRFAIVGIQGERWATWSRSPDFRFNYSYASWVGRSTYRGYPLTDRESPALVMELLEELDQLHSFGRVFAGGHSQGGFLTYMLHMHFPEKLAGTFPIAGGIPFQSEPRAFDDNKLIDQQRATPMVIIHGTKDRVVSPSMSDHAYRNFLAYDFPLVKRFSPEAGHPFDFLPIGDAIDWLDAMSTDDADRLRVLATKLSDEEKWRDVGAAIVQAKKIGLVSDLSQVMKRFEAAARKNGGEFKKLIRSNENGDWVDGFLEWKDQFSVSNAAQPLNEAYAELRKQHEPEADRIYSQARKAFRAKESAEGWRLYRQIVEQYYAAPRYRTLKPLVDNHFASERSQD